MSEINGRSALTNGVKNFLDRLTLMKVEAGELHLYKTMHALEEPIKVVGWELAEKLEKKLKCGCHGSR